MSETFETFTRALKACRICSPRFARTVDGHGPRPVVWVSQKARVLIAGQAPGARVHKSGRPFTDPSGDRLRAWLGLDEQVFYDREKIAIAPMAFCFPGHDGRGADLPPPKICASEWRARLLSHLPGLELTLLVGGYAQAYHLQAAAKGGVTRTVAAWRDHAPAVYPLPHPSWRNTRWLKENPWFEAELLTDLRPRLKGLLND